MPWINPFNWPSGNVKYRVHNTYILSFKALELQRTFLLSNALRQHWLSALALGAVWLDFNDSTLCLEFPTHVWCEYHWGDMDYNAVADRTQQQHSEMLIFGQSEYITVGSALQASKLVEAQRDIWSLGGMKRHMCPQGLLFWQLSPSRII